MAPLGTYHIIEFKNVKGIDKYFDGTGRWCIEGALIIRVNNTSHGNLGAVKNKLYVKYVNVLVFILLKYF